MTIIEIDDDLSNSPEAWSRRAEEHFSEANACLWTENGMRARHALIAEMLLPYVEKGDVIYDHGCGTGHLRDALSNLLWMRECSYVGWDRASGMRERARKTRPGANFPEAMPEKADAVVACGIYNLAVDWSIKDTTLDVFELWRKYHPKVLIVTFRVGQQTDNHISYSPLWISSVGTSLAGSRWMYNGTSLPHEAFLTVLR